MKQLTKDVLVSLFMGLVIPGLVLNGAWKVWNAALQTGQEEVTENLQSVFLPVKVQNQDGTVYEEDMDTYLAGVVRGEMPAYFETEALKAQAVVARTYAHKAYTTGGKHGNGSVCREPACCQAWISEEDYLQQGGTPEDVEKIRLAVQSTSGQVLTYQGELIEATYFSCSGGRTEDAAAVWGTDFPYLQAVDSPGEESAVHYRDTMTFSAVELSELLGLTGPMIRVGNIVYTEGGGVDTIEIGGEEFTGAQIRKKLGLHSAAFSITIAGDLVTIDTKGYGHRVGMSQYGADAMAVTGSTYEEILEHYYQGTELTRLDGK